MSLEASEVAIALALRGQATSLESRIVDVAPDDADILRRLVAGLRGAASLAETIGGWPTQTAMRVFQHFAELLLTDLRVLEAQIKAAAHPSRGLEATRRHNLPRMELTQRLIAFLAGRNMDPET